MENSVMKSPMKDEDDLPSFQEFNWEETTDDDTSDSPMKDEDDRKIVEYQWPSTNSANIWANEISQKCISDHADMRKSSADYNRPPLDHNNWSTEDYSECLSYLSNQSVVKMARNLKDSRLLQKILELNNYDHIQRMLDEVLSSIYEVMIYETGHALFVKPVEFCNDEQLHLILSTFQFHVICFYKQLLQRMGVISCFRDLATNVNGISLDVCIDHITNPLRKELLERIVNQSAYFAHDPSGNYVVQRIPKLGDIEMSNKVQGQEARHQDLVRVLMAHSSDLVDTKPGKHVISTINYLVT
ncbi:hypothetical protein KY285_006688 [Solanum tuberosum]|nr:hypothetical protein KY285_006688 [Solanum tuberosum]